MTTIPKITLITPNFNGAEYLEATIQSVLSQNYPNLEYIIVDGGSNDGSVDIIKKYEKHLAWWVSKPDKGQSHALNKGLERATGDIFNWVNSDDLLAPNALNTVAKAFQENDVDLICGHYTLIEKEKMVPSLRMHVSHEIERTMIFGHVSPCCLFWKMLVVRSIGYFNEKMHFCMDLEYWYRYLEKNGTKKFQYIEKNLAFFREHEYSKTVSKVHKFDEERIELQYSILKSIGGSTWVLKRLNKLISEKPNEWNWNFDSLNESKFTAFLIRDVLERFHKQFSISEFFALFFASFFKLPFPRDNYFYLLPIRRIKWHLSKAKK